MKSRGFTLIELMIVIAVVAILMAIAVPAYNDQVQKSRRADAISELLTTAQTLERCYTRTNSYQNCLTSNTFDSDEGYYTVTATVSAAAFDLSAAPKSGTSQEGDACGTYTLDHIGNRSASSSTDRCWGGD